MSRVRSWAACSHSAAVCHLLQTWQLTATYGSVLHNHMPPKCWLTFPPAYLKVRLHLLSQECRVKSSRSALLRTEKGSARRRTEMLEYLDGFCEAALEIHTAMKPLWKNCCPSLQTYPERAEVLKA